MKHLSKRSLAVLLALCLLFLPACRPFAVVSTPEEGILYITFLDVGQGDAILLQTDEGAILVDAGTEKSEEALIMELKTLGVVSLMLFVMTHPDADHIGGADGIINAFPIEEVWISGAPSESAANRRMEEALDHAGIEAKAVTKDTTYALGSLQLLVLSPIEPTSDTNASSVVILASYGETDLLLMGDADKKVEKRIIGDYPAWKLDCEILKAGHHGSKTASSAAFLEVALPEYTIISCGAGNSYGHPHGEVLDRLSDIDSEVLRTDLLGSISFHTDGRELAVGR